MDELKTDLARAKKGKPPLKDSDGKPKKNLTPEAYIDHALGVSIMQIFFLNNAALFNVQVREEDCTNQCKDR